MKKKIVSFTTVMLVVFSLSLIVMGFSAAKIEGLIRDSPPTSSTPFFEQLDTVIGDDGFWEAADAAWYATKVEKVEQAFCTMIDKGFVVGASPAKLYEQNLTNINFDCNGLVGVHTHPSGLCTPSNEDFYSTGFARVASFIIICDEHRAYLYAYANEWEPVKIQ